MAMLGQILMRKKLISLSQLEKAISLQSFTPKKLGELLIMQGLIQENELQQALKEQYWRRNGFWVIDE